MSQERHNSKKKSENKNKKNRRGSYYCQRKRFSGIAKKATKGVASTISDVIFLQFILWSEFLSNPNARSLSGLDYAISVRLDVLDGVDGVTDDDYFNRTLRRIKKMGWVDKNFKPTKKGKKRLNSKFNICFERPKKWDRNWYIVIFDIPENKRYARDLLRSKLKSLGFGMLQKSVWISPYKFLGDVEKIVKSFKLELYVFYGVSKKLGRHNAKDLANKVWKLNEINKQYKKLLEKCEEFNHKKFYSNKNKLNKVKFEYLSILQQDPGLPVDLLPEDWAGKRTYKIYRKLFKDLMKNITIKNK